MKKARFDPMYWALNGAQIGATAPLLLKKWRRFKARGDAYEWDKSRWNCDDTLPSEPTGPRIVFVAMGFAETRLAVELGRKLREMRPNVRLILAVRNRKAALEGHAIPPDFEVVPMPFDFCLPIARWRKSVRPDALVFIEKFWFANLARGLKNGGALVAAVAARTRDHRGGRYRFGAFYSQWLLGAFDLLCLRSKEERDKLGTDLPKGLKIRITGSLKFWPELPGFDPQRAKELKAWLELAQGRPILAAGSTQKGDEEWILEAFAPLREKFGAVLLLAPRHTARADEVEALIAAKGWKTTRRSKSIGQDASPDVLLLDTLGELTHAYGRARSAFIGGTIKGTGHNVLEPVAHGIPVFFGRKRGTFAAEQEMVEKAGIGFRVETPADLTAQWEKVLTSGQWCQEIAAKARQFSEEGTRAWAATVDALVELCDQIPKAGH